MPIPTPAMLPNPSMPPRAAPDRLPPVPSLVKWTGGKRSQAARIAALAPPHARYFEPFLGGGAVLYHLGRPGSVVGDDYAPLVALWRQVAETPDRVVADYRAAWTALQADLPGHFYAVRDRFNAAPNPADLNFLLRTCVNGIVRFNEAGAFNNSFHLSRPGMHPDRFAAVVRRWHARLRGVDIRDGDFARTVADAGPDDFVYLDPPYVGTRNRYQTGPDPDRLVAVLEGLTARGVRWALSYDGRRGDRAYAEALPPEVYRRKIRLATGPSAIGKVLNAASEAVEESLYLNY